LLQEKSVDHAMKLNLKIAPDHDIMYCSIIYQRPVSVYPDNAFTRDIAKKRQ
jgi:hypothetical protein